MRKVSLTNGGVSLVDDQDFSKVSGYKWFRKRNDYNGEVAVTTGRPREYLHRLVMEAPKGMNIDHINGNGLDNRRKNLRICTPAENSRNSKIYSNNTSGFKGLTWHKGSKRWIVRLTKNYKRIHIGYFTDVLEAAKAYNAAAIKHFGGFAKLNKIPK